jgi:nucleoside-diphosphate-sugar epimerase
MSEDYPVNPHSTYGVSKVAVDGYVQVRYREAGVNAIALRQFNCVGERETHPYVVPEIIGQLNRSWDRTGQKGTAIVRLGNNSFRDFLYAGDQAVMAVELLEKGQFGEVYNLGAESGVKIYELAEIIGHVMKFSSVKVEPDESRKRPWEIWGLLSDNMKIHSVISSRPTVSLAEGLKRTVNWFSENGRKWPWEN